MNYSAPLPQPTALLHRAAIARRLWRRRRVLASVFFIALLAGTAVTFSITPVYYAFGTVVIGEQEPNNMSPAWTQRLGDPADLESQLLIARSRRMLRLALARPGMTETAIRDCHASAEVRFQLRRNVDCSKLEPDSQALVEYVEAHYSVRALGRSRVISMGYQSVLPDAASILANGLLITYLEDQRAENARNREATAAWLLKELQRLDGELVKADAAQSKPTQGALSQDGIDQRKQFYLDLHRKVSDLEAERRTLVSSGRLVSLAEMPRLPYFPKRAPMLAATLAAAMLLAGLAALRRDATDTTSRGASDVENATHAPVIAALPHLDTGRRSGLFRFGSASVAGSSIADAAVRKLLGRLTMSGERHLLVTSTTADEGKTSVALALASIAAALGEKVLLIDADLARAAAAKRLGVTMRSGLTDILQGDCTLESVVVTTHAGFDVIAPGTSAGSYAARKLARDSLDGVMRSSASYDLVLIDGPAWDAGTEASRLAEAVDGLLWCVRWGHTNLHELGDAVTEYRDEAGVARVLGIVFTSVDLGELRWFETGTRMSAKRVARRLDEGPGDAQPRAPSA